MKTNAIILFFLGLFFLLIDAVYWIWNAVAHGSVEWVGSLAILMTTALAWFPAFFLWKASQGVGGELPEDRLDADIDDGDGDLGFFSPGSWWPITLAGSLSMTVLGFVLGWWLFFIGLALVAVSIVGWTFEYNRGHFAG